MSGEIQVGARDGAEVFGPLEMGDECFAVLFAHIGPGSWRRLFAVTLPQNAQRPGFTVAAIAVEKQDCVFRRIVVEIRREQAPLLDAVGEQVQRGFIGGDAGLGLLVIRLMG
jgi:hypothetical protein